MRDYEIPAKGSLFVLGKDIFTLRVVGLAGDVMGLDERRSLDENPCNWI